MAETKYGQYVLNRPVQIGGFGPEFTFAGEKDFKSFASGADKRENSVRTIFRCDATG